MSVSGTYCPPNCPKYPLFRTMYASTMLQLLELFRGLIVMHDRCADQDGVGPGLEHGVHLPSRLNPAHGDDRSEERRVGKECRSRCVADDCKTHVWYGS